MPFLGSITGFGYGRWERGITYYQTVGRAQWGTIVDSSLNNTNSYNQLILGVTCDSSNNIYICGVGNDVNQTVTLFYDASGNTQVQGNIFYPNTGTGGNKGFIGKYNKFGIAQVVALIAQAGGTSGQNNYDIKTDTQNNVYVTGGHLYIGANVGPNLYDSSGNTIRLSAVQYAGATATNSMAYFAKLNSDLKFQWAAGISAPNNTNARGAIAGFLCAVDTNNNVYFSGTYLISGTGTCNILDASGTAQSNSLYTLPQTSFFQSQFLIKYNSNGKVQWGLNNSFAVPGFITSNQFGLATDNANNVYYGLTINSTINVRDASGFSQSNSALDPIVAISSVNRAVLIKYNTDGKAQWATSFVTDLSGNETRSIIVDSKSNIYWIGQYTRNSTSPIFINDVSGTTQSNSLITIGNTIGGNLDPSIFIIKYNPDGKAQWAARCDQVGINLPGGGVFEGATKGCIDRLDNIYIVGSALPGVRFTMFDASGTTQVSSAVSFTPLASQCNAAYLIKYNSNGIAQWATYMNSLGNDVNYAVAADSENSIYTGGVGIYPSTFIFNAAGNGQVSSLVTLSGRPAAATNQYGTLVKYR